MKSLKLAALVLGLCLVSNGYAQRPEHELHSMMIYNFLKYIQWPGDQNSGEFVIGVLGDDEVYNTLNTWYGNKQKGDKKFIIKKFNSASEVGGCQLLYIGTSASNSFESLKGKLQNKSTLTITNKRGMAEKGSCINFRIVDNRLKFELNQAAMDNSNLKSSGQLAAMAILI